MQKGSGSAAIAAVASCPVISLLQPQQVHGHADTGLACSRCCCILPPTRAPSSALCLPSTCLPGLLLLLVDGLSPVGDFCLCWHCTWQLYCCFTPCPLRLLLPITQPLLSMLLCPYANPGLLFISLFAERRWLYSAALPQFQLRLSSFSAPLVSILLAR